MDSHNQLQYTQTNKKEITPWEKILCKLKEISTLKGKDKENKGEKNERNEEKNDKVKEIKKLKKEIEKLKEELNLEDEDDLEPEITETGESMKVNCCALKKNILAIGTNTGSISFRNLSNGQISKFNKFKKLKKNDTDFETINCIEMTPDSRYVVVGSNSPYIRFYQSVIKGEKVKKYVHRGIFEVEEDVVAVTAFAFGKTFHSKEKEEENLNSEIIKSSGIIKEVLYLNIGYSKKDKNYIKTYKFFGKNKKKKPKKFDLDVLFDKKYLVEISCVDVENDQINSIVYGHFINKEHIFISSSGPNIIIWDKPKRNFKENFKQKQLMDLHTGETVLTLTLNTKDQILVSGGADNFIKISTRRNKRQDFKHYQTLRSHEEHVRSVQFSHDNKMIISGSDDDEVKIWKFDRLTQNFHEYISLDKHEGNVSSVKLGGESNYAVSVRENGKISYIKLQEQLRYEVLQEVEVFEMNKEGTNIQSQLIISDVDILPDGSYFVSSTSKKRTNIEDNDKCSITVWKGNDKKKFEFCKKLKTHADRINCVKIRKYGNNLVVISCFDDGTIRTWHDKNGVGDSLSHEKIMDIEGRRPVILIDVNNSEINGLYMISCSKDKVIIWKHTKNYEFERYKDMHDDGINFGASSSVAISEDGNFAFSGHETSKISFWFNEGDVYKKSKCLFSRKSGKIYSLCYDDKTKLLLSGGKDKILRLWELKEDQKYFEKIQFFEDADEDITKVSFENDGEIIFATTNSLLSVYTKIKSSKYFIFFYKVKLSYCYGVNSNASMIIHADKIKDNIAVVCLVKPKTDLMDSCLLYETILSTFDSNHGNLNIKGLEALSNYLKLFRGDDKIFWNVRVHSINILLLAVFSHQPQFLRDCLEIFGYSDFFFPKEYDNVKEKFVMNELDPFK